MVVDSHGEYFVIIRFAYLLRVSFRGRAFYLHSFLKALKHGLDVKNLVLNREIKGVGQIRARIS